MSLGWRLVGVFMLGIAAFTVTLFASELSMKTALGVVVVLIGAAIVVWSRLPKEILFAGYILALTFNRQLFSFNDIFGNHGSHGLYWVPGDPIFMLLVMVQLLERVTGRGQVPEVPPPPVVIAALPIIPFLLAATLSALGARHAHWAFFELFRVLKFTFILVWLQVTMTRSMWYAGFAAFCLSIAAQSFLGLLQVSVGASASLLSAFGLERDDGVTNMYGVVEWYENRARGTLGHPNILGPYLLTLVPTFLGILIYSRARLIRIVSILLLGAGLACLFMTKSRSPIALIPFGLLFITVVGLLERRVSLRMVLSAVLIVSLAVAAILTPYMEAISKRLTGDFAASVDFRHEYNLAALQIWDDAPVFGIGLNNFTVGLQVHYPKFYEQVVELESMRGSDKLRALAPVHNVYLLILSESGILGILGFVFLLGAAMRRFARAFLAGAGAVRGFYLGLCTGFFLEWVQQMVDFSLWVDPYWYTLAVLIALASRVPALKPVVP